MRTRKPLLLGPLAAVICLIAAAIPVPSAQAITGGVADAGEHPYVGMLLFYDPDDQDPGFPDPGSWFGCTGTLMSSTIVLTAGHCTFGTGTDKTSTLPSGSGGHDVWISFAENPDTSVLPPASDFATSADRYAAAVALLNANPEWHRATAFPHPQYDPSAFFTHDAGVLRLDVPIAMATYGRLPTLGLLNTLYKQKNTQHYTPVGYGYQDSKQRGGTGSGTRRKADVMLVNLEGVYGTGKGTSAKFSNTNGKFPGGTCFGDSGGPILKAGGNQLVAVVSFGASVTCRDGTGGYRMDQADDLAFLSSFGITP